MYDKVKFMQRGAVNIENYRYKLPPLNNIQIGENYIIGNLSGLKIRLCFDCLTVEGSLAKFHFGNNIETLNIHTTKEAIDNISDLLGIDMHQSKVISFEFGTNFQIKHDVSVYLQLLGEFPRLKRSDISNESLYYMGRGKGKRKPKTICFYNKTAEIKTRHNNAKVANNLLRYEIRFNGGLRNRFGVEVLASTLYEVEFYTKLVQLYHDYYFSINKIKSFMGENAKVTDLFDMFVSSLMKGDTKDKRRVIDCFISSVATKLKHRSDVTRLKKRLYKLIDKTTLLANDDLIAELDEAIERATRAR